MNMNWNQDKGTLRGIVEVLNSYGSGMLFEIERWFYKDPMVKEYDAEKEKLAIEKGIPSEFVICMKEALKQHYYGFHLILLDVEGILAPVAEVASDIGDLYVYVSEVRKTMDALKGIMNMCEDEHELGYVLKWLEEDGWNV